MSVPQARRGARDRCRAWILLTPAMFSATLLAAFALARTAGRTQLEATVMRRAKLRKADSLLERPVARTHPPFDDGPVAA